MRRSMPLVIVFCLAGASSGFAQHVAELNKDPAILGFRLGMTQQQVRDWFAANSAEYPKPTIQTLKVTMPGAGEFDGAISVNSAKDKVKEQFLFQFSPPFDGNVLVGILRDVNYGLDLGSPNARAVDRALSERYGAWPSSSFIGRNSFWASGSSLTEEAELRSCTYSNQLSANQLLPATQGCGITLDVEMSNNSSHPGSVFILQTTLWNQDRIVENQKKANAVVDAAEAEKAKSTVVPGSAAPKL